jgi:hypothetical protein
MIRASYLGKGTQANADFDKAIALRPDDKQLRRVRDHLGSDNGSTFGKQAKAKPEEMAPVEKH